MPRESAGRWPPPRGDGEREREDEKAALVGSVGEHPHRASKTSRHVLGILEVKF